MKLREHIDAFRIYLSDATGRPSDDISVPNRLIAYEIIGASNELLKDIDKKEIKLIAPTICISLKEVDIVECPCAPEKGCTYMKSKVELPDIYGVPLDVSFSDSSQSYSFLEWTKFQYKLQSRTKADREGAYYTIKKVSDTNHLYVYHKSDTTNLKVAQLTAIPLDPISFAAADCNGAGKVCDPMGVSMVIPETFRSKVFAMVAQKLGMARQLQGNGDILNNDNADNRAQVPM
jgi:hypothetical protein